MSPRPGRSSHRWRRRALLVVGGVVVLLAGTSLLGFEPEPVRVLLLGAVLGVGVAVLADAAPPGAPVWTPPTPASSVTHGRDRATQVHLRHLENHQAARQPDAAVRDRLRATADRVLQVRHGVRADSDRGRELLGPGLVEVLEGPVVRMSPRRIDEVLRQIEELS